MRYNVYVTAAFKNHHNTFDIVRALFDQEGNIKPFYKFKKDALLINNEYNKLWLEAEYNTALGTARMASKWPEYQRRGGSLEYRTQKDGRVRDEHRLLDGAIYPVNHSFWDTHYPPLAWRCRCFVKHIREVITKVIEGGLPEIKKMFQNNAGKTGKVFNDAHPYFTTNGEFKSKAQNLFGYKPPIDLDKYKNNLSLYEALKDDKDYKLEFVDNLTGGFVFRHTKHPLNFAKINLPPARMLVRARGDSVILNEVIQNQKNIDALVNGELLDFKEVEVRARVKNAINNKFKSARKQGASNLAVILKTRYKSEDLAEGIRTAFYNDKNRKIQKITFITDEGKILDIERKDYENGLYRSLIKKVLDTMQ